MMAWLHAVPKPAEGSARAKAAEQNKLSRLEQMTRQGIRPAMPPNPAPQFVAWFIEMGIVENGGMGPVPLSWTAIAAWQRVTGVTLQPWEARLIRKLSIEYIDQKSRAESESCPAPWRGKVTDRECNIEDAALRRVLG